MEQAINWIGQVNGWAKKQQVKTCGPVLVLQVFYLILRIIMTEQAVIMLRNVLLGF